jgi:hypothetical protein
VIPSVIAALTIRAFGLARIDAQRWVTADFQSSIFRQRRINRW